MQREINSAQEMLARAFVLVDELVFREAKRDELSKEVYRVLSSIHKGFGDLTRKVEETGKLARSARDQERKMEEFAKQPLDLRRIAADTEAVARENAALDAQLRGA